MNSAPGGTRILVATEDTKDADLVVSILGKDFDQLRASVNADQAVGDFEDFRPQVLVLAFNTLEKAQRYYLGLYRRGELLRQHAHRTVLLCTKDEVQAAFELCKKHVFDDYVHFWPYALDGPRLSMSVLAASREMTAASGGQPQRSELISHARQLGDLERTLSEGLSSGEEKIAAARQSLHRFESEIARTSEEFSRRLLEGQAAGLLQGKDADALTREIDRLKHQQIEQARQAGTIGVDPVTDWARSFRSEIGPALAGTRAFAEKVRKLRPLLMVVEDDELTRNLLARALDPEAYEIMFAGDSTDALRELRRLRPDVILMDVRLPGLDGVSFTRSLKESPEFSSIPVIMLTGDSRRETLMSSVDAGATDFVVKPFTRESLKSKLEKALSR